jgi:hypothetical protein
MTHHEMPVLGGIAALLRWLEDLVSLIACPALTIGLGIALTDLFTGGDLLHAVPPLLFVWALSQAVGVDAQLIGAWD